MNPIDTLDAWLRGEFVRINTELEEVYFAERADIITGQRVDALKQQLVEQGGPLMKGIAAMPELPPDSHASYRLLGLIGHYLAACQRHEAPLTDHEGGRLAAWDVSTRIGSALGVVPRFVFAHQALFNEAIGGRFRTFTSLPDEEVFLRYNALGVIAYYRAAHALGSIAGIGVSSAVASYLFDEAEAGLQAVLRFNQDLGRQLDVDRFFFNIRPYFKTYRVGDTDFRGANAGDFSAINEIDVSLGLCSMDHPFYRAVVREKAAYVPPDDLPAMRSLDRRPSLLLAFIDDLDRHGATDAWKTNARRFLAVCKAHGAANAYHQHRFIRSYLEEPEAAMPTTHSAGVTSGGPPLPDVIRMLQRLLDMRMGRGDTPVSALLARIGAHLT